MSFGHRSATPAGNAGVYLGKVTRLVGSTAYVEVPRLAPGFEYPARYPDTPTLRPGDEVAAAFLEGGRDELVVLVRLA